MTPLSINLALQGGGAHGAFTWGALTRILEDPEIEIAAISGTSAGALNGAALKAGLTSAPGDAGRQAALDNLDWLWAQMGAVNDPGLQAWLDAISPPAALMSRALEYSLPVAMIDAYTRAISPYALGAAYQNPLRRIVDRFRFDRVCSHAGPAFFVNTTRVSNGKIRVFTQDEMCTDVILASACLPSVFQAVEIYDTETDRIEAFWDGGYTGNPALFPLFDPAFSRDVVIINVNPLETETLPRTPMEIQNRINEISFNSSLLRELRAIAFVQRMLTTGALTPGTMRDLNIHMISDDVLMNALSVATKMVPLPTVLGQLKIAGYDAAAKFLDAHKADLGVKSTVDLPTMFG
ncbi:patatin-like phospholipase family protein [Pseudoruegeria sp. SK021]|uniref:patatin-like phospholipase family protein n=1 Tax=Pseudoruegeria sp. SK021 TaxID=1933035 RepID=UPI000A23DECE|nr:patatin-like phospholipase family protein [Pseudoruegeria sp. SK021]OSP55473.1 patatin [Pseudoruegeria sp. SK021]